MVVVFGQSDDVSIRSNLKSAATGYLDVGTADLGEKPSLSGKDGHVKLVSVRIPNEDVPLARDVDSVRKVSDALISDSANKVSQVVEDDDGVTLEVADVVELAVAVGADGDVRRLENQLFALDVVDHRARVLVHDEDGGSD